MHENSACRPQYYIGDTLIKVRKYEGAWLPVTWNCTMEFFDLMHRRKMLGTDLFWAILVIIQLHGFHCAERALSRIQAIKLRDCCKQKAVMKTSSLSCDAANKTFQHLYWLGQPIPHAIRVSRTNKREKESKSNCRVSFLSKTEFL